MLATLAVKFDRAAITKMVGAGSLWGLVLSAGFFLNALYHCGLPCPDDIVAVTAACIGTGILTIGPIAAFGSR